jgi:hypothetical protein
MYLKVAVAAALFCGAAVAQPVGPGDRVQVSRDGLLRFATGDLYVPLGGYHGNVLPVSRIDLRDEELARVKPVLWSAQTTDGQGHVDLWDASDEMMDRWFRKLAADGTTAIRLFARARVGNDVLDLCGKLNPELKQVFHRAFRVARPHGIRFLLQILPEPGSSCYVSRNSIERRALPRYSQEELAALPREQKRFLLEKRTVRMQEYFTDPDVLACQNRYLREAVLWVASEPQIFALEIYNEQNWNGRQYMFPLEDAEIRWSAEIVKTIKRSLGRMPVTLSHPGFGITGYEPLKWTRAAKVDFYSPHAYAGISGENESVDFAAVTAASAAIMNAGIPSFYGEWGLFNSPVPMELKRFSHRDAIWLCLTGRQGGFLQWTNEFPEEYRWPSKLMKALPRGFSPERPRVAVSIGGEYRTFHTNTRYPLFREDGQFPAFEFNRQKRQDANIQRIFAAYKRSLEIGVPVAFRLDGEGMTLDEFATFDPSRIPSPIRVSGGYQLSYMKDARSPLWIAYLRKRRIQGFQSHFVGVPEAAPLEIALHLPRGRYTARLINLSANRAESRLVSASDLFQISPNTSDDYVVVIASESLKLAMD